MTFSIIATDIQKFLTYRNFSIYGEIIDFVLIQSIYHEIYRAFLLSVIFDSILLLCEISPKWQIWLKLVRNSFEIIVDGDSTSQNRISFKLLQQGIFLFKSRYTDNSYRGIIFPVYRYQTFLIPNNPTV